MIQKWICLFKNSKYLTANKSSKHLKTQKSKKNNLKVFITQKFGMLNDVKCSWFNFDLIKPHFETTKLSSGHGWDILNLVDYKKCEEKCSVTYLIQPW